MGKLKIKKKMYSRPKPNPNLADTDSCWCGGNLAYAQCHKLWDRIHDRREEALTCVKPGQ